MSDFREEVWKILRKESFTNEASDGIPALAQDNPKRIVIAVMRRTIAPFINRSEDPDETVSIVIPDGREIIEVPSRKFKSKEKLLGLRLCKAFGVVDPKYEYNAVKNKSLLNNPNSVLFGDTVVETGRGNQAMFPSRVLYSSSYSIRKKVDLTRKLTHNALSSQGTMWDREKSEFRQSIFETEYVVPGTIFPSFITLKDPTPEMLYHFIRTLNETSYGAQTSITGSNIRNQIIGILACKVEPPISSYTVSEEIGQVEENVSSEEIFKNVQDLIQKEFHDYASKNGGVLLTDKDVGMLLGYFESLSEKDLETIYHKMSEDSNQLWEFAGFKDKIDKRKKNKTDG